MIIRLLLFFTLSLSIKAFSLPEISKNLMVSGPARLALESALRVGKEGGNIVDSAVAYALTLSVTHPYFGSLGGGGFALVNLDGKPEALDFREQAPLKTNKEYYVNRTKNSQRGGSSVGVPGIPMGLWTLHKKHGTRPWRSLFKEALFYSKKGFPVSSKWYTSTLKIKDEFWKEGVHHLLLKGKVPLPGELLKQPALYRALRIFKNRGPKGFYEGSVAKDISSSVLSSGGDMSLEDLKSYEAKWRTPIKAEFQGHDIYLMPPPSSGGVIIKTALELVGRKKLPSTKLLSVNELHLLSEVMAKSFRGRALLGDPDFNKNPVNYLSSDNYLKKLSKKIRLHSVRRFKPIKEKEIKESLETTHFVIMNKEGQAVSMTLTLNGNYGSKVVSKKFGIALNNEMDDFTTQPGVPNMYGLTQGPANYVQPKKRPLSSMSPTLALKNGKVVLAIGAPGGPRIINGVFQTLYRSLINDLNMEEAIYTPRLHHQFLPPVTFYENHKFSPETLNRLKKRGHKLKPIKNVAIVYGIKKNKKGFLEGAADHRGEGFVGGY